MKQLEAVKRDKADVMQAGLKDEENLKLKQKQLETLLQQKEDLQKRANVDNSPIQFQHYQDLLQKKNALEAKIREFENELNVLKEPAILDELKDPQRKATLREMIDLDAKNARLRQKISNLKEDLTILKQQVHRLDRKLRNSNDIYFTTTGKVRDMHKSTVNTTPTVRALIEVSITPQQDVGLDNIAQRIYAFPEVKSCYLVSGGYDLLVVIEGDNIQMIAEFVAAKLSSMPNVRQTATHFLLKKYKEEGQILKQPKNEKRQNISY